MRLKSYFAATVEAAMALAARELGDEALLIYSREATPETRYLGAYEVVFAAGQPEAPAGAKPAPLASQPRQPSPVPAGGSRTTEMEQFAWASSALAELKSEIGFLRQDVASHRRCVEDLLTATDRRAWRLLADWGSEPELLPGVALAGSMLQSDMDPEHVLDVIECARDAVRAAAPAVDRRLQWQRAVERELTERRDCRGHLEPAGQSRAIALIGPPGAGRTTVAMQLTAHAAARNLEPRLVSFEPGRLSASQTLRSFAAVLGAPFELSRRGDALAAHLAGLPAGTLTLIDGPGLGMSPTEGPAQLMALLRRWPHLETWLVLPSTLRACDLRLMIDRFAAYAPSRLVFTRTGEARHWGAIWSAAEWARLPIAFFCDGPRVPEDLSQAAADSLASRLLSPPQPAGAGAQGGAQEAAPIRPGGQLATAGGRS